MAGFYLGKGGPLDDDLVELEPSAFHDRSQDREREAEAPEQPQKLAEQSAT